MKKFPKVKIDEYTSLRMAWIDFAEWKFNKEWTEQLGMMFIDGSRIPPIKKINENIRVV